jgi:hypothetical protein
MRYTTFLAAFACAASCFAQTPMSETEARKELEALCQKVLCRQPTTVRVQLRDGKVLEVPFRLATPIVLLNGWVSVLPGEEVHVAFDVEGGELRNPRAVKKGEAKNTLSFRFSQDDKGDTLLVIDSTLEQAVKYDLGMMLPDSERVRKTSSCPVLGGKSSYEHWPHPIFQFVAARFRLLPAGSPMNCE